MLQAWLPGGFSSTFPVTSLTPTRRTARCSCWARSTARAFANSTSPRSPRSRMRRPFPAPSSHFMHPVKSRNRHPARVRRVRRAQLRPRQRGRAEEDRRGDRRLPRPDLVGARGRAVAQQQDPARAQVRRCRRQGRAPAGQGPASRQGARHHFPRRLADGDAGGVHDRARRGRQADRQGRRGARPARCRRRLPVALRGGRGAGAALRLRARHRRWGGPSAHRRALPADVRAGTCPGGGGGVADRARRCAARQRAVHQRRQLRHAVRCGAHGLQLPGPADRPRKRRRASR